LSISWIESHYVYQRSWMGRTIPGTFGKVPATCSDRIPAMLRNLRSPENIVCGQKPGDFI
jgi:hypothetical protein